jgi:ribosomal-protein-alanine N-acetyltransferase
MAGDRINPMQRLAFLGQVLPFAIAARAEDELLGWAMIERDERDRGVASLGFWLGEVLHGNGYMRAIAPIL